MVFLINVTINCLKTVTYDEPFNDDLYSYVFWFGSFKIYN